MPAGFHPTQSTYPLTLEPLTQSILATGVNGERPFLPSVFNWCLDLIEFSQIGTRAACNYVTNQEQTYTMQQSYMHSSIL